jgi:hypothetical protein
MIGQDTKKYTSILFYQSSLMKAASLKRMSQSVNIISWSEYKLAKCGGLTQADA